jgi:hypothetical protein
MSLEKLLLKLLTTGRDAQDGHGMNCITREIEGGNIFIFSLLFFLIFFFVFSLQMMI